MAREGKEKEVKEKKLFGLFKRKKAEVEETEQITLENNEEQAEPQEEQAVSIEEILEQQKLEPVDYYEFIETTSKKMENHKARIAGSWGEKRAARMLRDTGNSLLGIPSRLEPFYSYPLKGRGSSVGLGIIYAASLIVYFLSFSSKGAAGIVLSLISLLVALAGGIIAISLFLGKSAFEPLLKKKISYNVLSSIEPKSGNAEKTLLITSSYDSKYGSGLKMPKKALFWILAVSICSFPLFLLFALLRAAVGISTTASLASFIVIPLAICVPSAVMLIFIVSLSKSKVEENNSLSTAIALATARYLIDENKIPENTRVAVASFAADKAGHDGVKAFCDLHEGGLLSNAVVLHIGDIVRGSYYVAKFDVPSRRDFDSSLISTVMEKGAELGIDIKECEEKFGAVDGFAIGEFAKRGIPAVSFFCDELSPFAEIDETLQEDINTTVQKAFKLSRETALAMLYSDAKESNYEG
ncbi:MAG: hypothetical protein GX891_00700 [Clostridiales bacterium]|nr:hypothetical protein [Clostridiales bacterium]